jgi:hypothetical protein
MKTKTVLIALLNLAIGLANAQITPSMTIPTTIPNYDGSYDDFGSNHLFYPNAGEVRYNDEEQSDAHNEALFYTMNTHPRMFLLNNNNISFTYGRSDVNSSGVEVMDSLHRIDLEWSGSNSGAFLARVDTQNFAVLNYFTEWFGSSGRTGVKGGAAIACQSIYNNIDLVYTSNKAGLVMYFIIYPGGDFNDIVMHVNGSNANSIVSNKLKINASWDYTTFERPRMYQYAIVGNVVSPLTVCNPSWQSLGNDDYKIINSTSYNTALPLIVQIKQANPPPPIHTVGMKWSTYFGSNQFDFILRTHCDASDNLYVAGYSDSPTFPQSPAKVPLVNSNGDGNGIIAKFSTTGKLLWSTFVGGSGPDAIHDMDFRGDTVYCVGKTTSNNLLCKHKAGASTDSTAGGGWDGFIFEFTFNGPVAAKHWVSYYGGNGNDELNGIKFDAAGNMFVVGMSASTDLSAFGPGGSYTQAFNSAQLAQGGQYTQSDGLIAKFNAGTSLNSWFTFYGSDALGANANAYSADYIYGLAIKGSDLYVCGKAGGTNLPNSSNAKIVNGDFDGFLAHFTTGGVMSSGDAKYTDGNTINYSVKVRGDSVYTVGETGSNLLTTNSGAYYFNGSYGGNTDGCFSVHPLNLSSTIHNSYLGGNDHDAAYDIQITPNNLILIAGGTGSSNFPTYNLTGPYNSTGNPVGATWSSDNFISCLAVGNTNLVWSTYLGSPGWAESNYFPVWIGSGSWPDVTTMAVTSANGLYVAGISMSANTFPLDEWYSPPTTYFQPANSQWSNTGCCDGTITRVDMAALGENTGIKDFKNTEFVFGFYPNPVSKSLFITNKAIVNDDLRYAVYDTGGRKLQEGKLKASDKKEIDVSSLSQGVYIINVSNEKMTYSNKFVKVVE